MTQYECMMIIDPTVGEETISQTTDNFEKLLKAAKAKGVKKDVWGDKKLAYNIKGSETGHYILWTLEMDGSAIKDINTQLNLDNNIWRYMFVNLDD